MLFFSYCTNISFYMMLKAKKVPVQNHPVIKRLVQYRNVSTILEAYKKSPFLKNDQSDNLHYFLNIFMIKTKRLSNTWCLKPWSLTLYTWHYLLVKILDWEGHFNFIIRKTITGTWVVNKIDFNTPLIIFLSKSIVHWNFTYW